MLWRAILVKYAVGPRRVVGHGLEGAGVESGVEPLAGLAHGPVGGLVGDDDLVELTDGREADWAVFSDLTVDGVEGRHVVL